MAERSSNGGTPVSSPTSATERTPASSLSRSTSSDISTTSRTTLTSTTTSSSSSSTSTINTHTSSSSTSSPKLTHYSTQTTTNDPSPTVPITSNTSHQRLPLGVIIAVAVIGTLLLLGVVVFARFSWRSRRTVRPRDDSTFPPPKGTLGHGGYGGHGNRHSMYIDERHYSAVPALPRHSQTHSDASGNPFEAALEKHSSGSSGNIYPAISPALYNFGGTGDDPTFSHPLSSSNGFNNEKNDVPGVGGPRTGSSNLLPTSPLTLPSNPSSNASSRSILDPSSNPGSPSPNPPSPTFPHPTPNAPSNMNANSHSFSDGAAPQTFPSRKTSLTPSSSSHASASVAVPGVPPVLPSANNHASSRNNSISRYSAYSAHSGSGGFRYGQRPPYYGI